MLTNTMPSVMRALQSTLDSATLKSFTQALGNCNQPLEHRGNVSLTPPNYFVREGEYYGDTYNGYNTNNYTQYNPFYLNAPVTNIFGPFNPIFPPVYQPDPILPPDINIGDRRIDLGDTINNNINNNLYNNSFFFPTTNNFNNTTNNHFGGNTTIDNTYIDNSYTDNSTVKNFNVTNINGNPVQGPAGPPGQRGSDGRDGRDGAPGAPGAVIPFPFPVITPPSAPPPPPPTIDLGGFIRGTQPFVTLPEVKVQPEPTTIYVSTYTFDAATCSLTESLVPKTVRFPEITIPGGSVNLEGFQLANIAVPLNGGQGQ
jgi:hypothetical protein